MLSKFRLNHQELDISKHFVTKYFRHPILEISHSHFALQSSTLFLNEYIDIKTYHHIIFASDFNMGLCPIISEPF